MDPVTQAIMGIMPSIIGQKQLGGVAPPFNTMATGQGVGGLLGNALPILPRLAMTSDPLGELMGGPKTASTPPVDLTADELDPVAESLKQSSLKDIDNGPEKPGLFEGFFGGLDKGLQSPSQVLGLGLLGRINPDLPLAGLLAMGLLNRNR